MKKQLFSFISKYMTLTAEEKNAIIELDIFKSYKKGTVLLKQGEFSEKSYFVLQGIIRSYYILDGEEKTTAFYTESEPFSPLCVIDNKPSKHYVSCLEDCIIAVSTPDMEEGIFKKFPRFESLCRILSEELLAKQQLSFDDFKNSSPEQRYQHLSESRPDLIQRVPQYQIASFLGIKPESLSRIRKRLLQSK
jgi:CRP-like cAMP-binding protein